MSVRKRAVRFPLLLVMLSSVFLLLAHVSSAAAAPQWRINSLANTQAAPGTEFAYHIQVTNVGDEPTSGPYTVAIELPPGITAVAAETGFGNAGFTCSGPGGGPVAGASSITCVHEQSLASNDDTSFAKLQLMVVVDAAAQGIRTARMEITGGGAPEPASTLDPTRIAPGVPAYGFDALDAAPLHADGSLYTQAGGHPDSFVVSFDFPTATSRNPMMGEITPVEGSRDLITDLPPGFVGNPTSADTCTNAELADSASAQARPSCPAASQVGTILLGINDPVFAESYGPVPVYNLVPPPGSPAAFGFQVVGSVVTLKARLRNDGEYALSVDAAKIPAALDIATTQLVFWGKPGDESHRSQRSCPGQSNPWLGGPTCPGAGKAPFLRMPTSCANPGEGLRFDFAVDSWENPAPLREDGAPELADPRWHTGSVRMHEPPGYPADPEDPTTPWGPEKGVDGCGIVPVKGKLEAKPTAIDAQTSSGLDVHVEVPNPGLENPDGIASSDIRNVEVVLPEGVTINPSQAEGLGVCTPAQYASAKLSFEPGAGDGCPDDAKIGTVQMRTPLLAETVAGDIYVAKPYDNPFGTLLALYVVLHEPERGILIKLPAKVTADERTGRITTSFSDLPQLPFTDFHFSLRQGARAPLVTPSACGTYTTEATFTPWSDPSHPVVSKSSFEIVQGVGGGACPSGGVPPFKPGLIAGSLNNAAGKYSPFDLRLFRSDQEQEIRHFSIKLPPGLVAKLAGVPFCPDIAISLAASRSGAEEIAAPSCPPASEIGRTLVGAGVGSVLTYAPGKIYLAGPYNGSALSIAAITAAKVGPFDLGTVVVREALKVNPETAEVFVDPTGSDPLPHIIDGITTHLRDIRAYIDRPEFTLNPTSCERTSIASTVLGSGLDFASAADDQPVTVTTPYQAADCAALAFKPKLHLHLTGGMKRGGHPKLKAVLRMPPIGANIARAQVALPHSEFLAQAHLGTTCTRVQFAAGAGGGTQCPKRSVYGYARAQTPLLDEPLQGPVFLRSSRHELPDLVAALRSGKIEIHLVGRLDSDNKGGIRTTFESVPDAPVSRFTLTMFGGKKSLLENSTDLCRRHHRATVKLKAHNDKQRNFAPVLHADSCKKKPRGARRERAGR
jgi:hypothetical protein